MSRPLHRGLLGLIVAACWCSGAYAQNRGGFSARWIGQDGHDLVGPSAAPGPNDVQDVHLGLTGLPARAAIEWLTVEGLGGGTWSYNVRPEAWRAAVVRKPGATTADVYFEPFQNETGRPFTVVVKLDNGRTLEARLAGGKADPNLRVASAMLKARWLGQDGQDHAGRGPAVGPDGFQDAHLHLSGLSPQAEIQAVTVSAGASRVWQSGTNPERANHAELIRRPNDPTSADLYFQPTSDLAGVPLALRVRYAQDKSDQATVLAGNVNPRLAMPAVAPYRLVPNRIEARWLGQDGSSRVGPGDVHVRLSGLPARAEVQGVALSDGAGASWARQLARGSFTPEPYAMPLSFLRGRDPTTADLHFPPVRDESGRRLVLRLDLGPRTSTVVAIDGGPSDPRLRAGPMPAATSITARPGDNLPALVDQYGQILLKAGVHRLSGPLVLGRPVVLKGEPGAVIEFAQAPDAPPWTAAIKIRAGHTTLEGFAVRFTGPIRWRDGIPYGPAVIGTSDNFDDPRPDLLADIQLVGLDLQAPPASGRAEWEEAVRLIRLVGATCGRIEGNMLKGGTIEFFGGPWTVSGNEFRGTPAGTFSQAVFAGHHTHDLVLKDNRARSEPPSGKTWRFLVLTGSGTDDVVADNRVEGVGPRDDDAIPSANAPEIILTESYRLHFEGRPTALAAEGRVLQIPPPQGEPARGGSVVAILSGDQAGTWHRVMQAIDPQTYLVEPPLPQGDYAVSLATGFVAEVFRGNTIDARGGSVAVNLVLAGNHFGTIVEKNHFLGAGEAFKIAATASESPRGWGWSHAPVFGVVVRENTIEDSLHGGQIGVEHGPAVKSSAGRVYLSGTIERNTGVFGEAVRQRPDAASRAALVLGDPGSVDPDEIRVNESGNTVRAIAGRASPRPEALHVRAGTVNGRPVREAARDRPAR
jgi:hypothetical protein